MEAFAGVDVKASIIATVQAAALAALLTTTTPSKLTAPSRALFVTGIGALLVGVGMAGVAIFPRPGLRRPSRQNDGLHFSDLHEWQPEQLAVHLARQTERLQLEALARRLVWASRIVWWKYVWLQRSLLAAGVAVATLTAAHLLWSHQAFDTNSVHDAVDSLEHITS